jgi:hypothetical protein
LVLILEVSKNIFTKFFIIDLIELRESAANILSHVTQERKNQSTYVPFSEGNLKVKTFSLFEMVENRLEDQISNATVEYRISSTLSGFKKDFKS